ncbi:peptidoglycan-binding protein [Clostridia bacterium]|nr:peptidoglycan-binding protein [Clostridia bacterium]
MIGHLKINVFKGDVGSPCPDSQVTIKSVGTEGNTVEEAITDSSGQTDIFNLEAPPVDYSLEPQAPKPYSEYTITVIQEGFESVTINGIQILADVIAEQNVFMKPSTQQTQNQDTEKLVFRIPEHTLYGEYPSKIAESDVKPLPAATGFVVLKEPVVPEFIIVHDGGPSDNTAPNYWVPYKDYIKNVASSEIYATWPAECIKANILAIISFTLNRVYTEWYRSRGHNFTITSSTAYDHKFIYQRNIFTEISQIVDDIFATYVTRPNIEQPLFTQYCDGVKVTCPNWLTQWGSKDLADDGEDYLNILRTFYGTNIYLETANEILGIPSSYKGEVLQVGSRNDEVRTIQNQLNAISKNYPAIQKISVDGVYGNGTMEAVKKFQGIFGLPQTGSVDYATWYEISKIYTAVQKLA